MKPRSGIGVTSPWAIILAALTLIAVIWLGSFAALRANRGAVEARAAAEIANEALMFADRMNEHLAAIDQVLHVLEHDWETNPEGFDLPAWRQRALVLSDASLQVFVTDANGVIRQATDPAQIGEHVGDETFFRNRAALPSDDGQMYVGGAVPQPQGDGWTLTMSRRLDLPDGSFAGVITVSYDPIRMIRYFRQTGLGGRGVIELVSERNERLLAATGAGAEPGESIAGSAMWQAIKHTPDGRWTGPSAPDGVERLHAFRQLHDHNLDLIFAESVADALRPAATWEREALAFVSLTTVLVAILAGALLLEARAARRRVAMLARERVMLAAAKADADAKSQRLEVTLAGMSDGVMMMDAGLRLLEWNSRFPEMIGVPAAMLTRGMSLAEVLRAQAEAGEFGPVDVVAEVATRIASVHTGGDSVTTERLRPDGRTIAVRRRRVADGSFVTIYMDITERKHNEDMLRQARLLAEATAEAKSRFVAMVSHEIRQPLNALLNSLSLLGGNELAPAPRRLVEMAQQSGDALLGLLNDILEMSKMEAGQLALRPEVFVLRPLLQGVVDMFVEQAAGRGMTLHLSIAEGTPERLLADPVRIRQILMNLMSNAVKFSAPGSIVLAAAVEHGVPGILRLTVRDPGPAIDAAGRARLFQPFAQLGDPADGGLGGTGLGLAICQTLAGLLGGSIGHEPTGEGGNAFWVRLAYGLPQVSPVPRPIHPRSRVLLVEDIRANQMVIATMLRRDGHMVDVANSGAAAVRALASQPYDVVLMDILMPGMSGIAATRHIRALPGPAGKVPICALTGNASAEDRALCEAAGMNDVLIKPVEHGALIDVLGRLVWQSPPTLRPEDTLQAPAESPGPPLLLASRLSELRANLPPGALTELADQCITEMTARLATLQAALLAGDTAVILAEAHALSGLAGNYAMTGLESCLDGIIEAARGGGEAQVAAGALDSMVARSAVALRQAVNPEMAQ